MVRGELYSVSGGGGGTVLPRSCTSLGESAESVRQQALEMRGGIIQFLKEARQQKGLQTVQQPSP